MLQGSAEKYFTNETTPGESKQVLSWFETNPKVHPILTNLRNSGDKSRWSHYLVDMLKENNDPRSELIVEPIAVSKDVFEVSGDPDETALLGWGKYG